MLTSADACADRDEDEYMTCAQSAAQLFLFIWLFFMAVVRWLQALFHLVGQIGYLAGSAVLIVGRSGLHVCLGFFTSFTAQQQLFSVVHDDRY